MADSTTAVRALEVQKMRGLTVDILRSACGTDCTNMGDTSPKRGYTTAILLGIPDGNITAEEARTNGRRPTLVLCKKPLRDGTTYLYAVPIGHWLDKKHTMMGGNFVYSCDGRYRSICDYPIPVHDRIG